MLLIFNIKDEVGSYISFFLLVNWRLLHAFAVRNGLLADDCHGLSKHVWESPLG